MTTPVHVLMVGTVTFCDRNILDPEFIGNETPIVTDGDWHDEPERVQLSTCHACLLRIFMLGDSARFAMSRMGLRIDVIDVDPNALQEN